MARVMRDERRSRCGKYVDLLTYFVMLTGPLTRRKESSRYVETTRIEATRRRPVFAWSVTTVHTQSTLSLCDSCAVQVWGIAR